MKKRHAPKLTANDLALAQMGCAHAIAWWKKRGRTKFARAEIAKYDALNKKLNSASDAHNPFEHSDDMPLDWGDHPIYVSLPLPRRKPPRNP